MAITILRFQQFFSLVTIVDIIVIFGSHRKQKILKSVTENFFLPLTKKLSLANLRTIKSQLMYQ